MFARGFSFIFFFHRIFLLVFFSSDEFVLCVSVSRPEKSATLHWIRRKVNNSIKIQECKVNWMENGQMSEYTSCPDFYCLLPASVKFVQIFGCIQSPKIGSKEKKNNRKKWNTNKISEVNEADVQNQIEFESYNFIDIDIWCLS